MSGGVLIAFEGIDGSGKTTQARVLYQRLREHDVDVVLTQEPGGTDFGEMARELLKRAGLLSRLSRALAEPSSFYRKDVRVSPRAELLLFVAARAQLVDEVIRPQLARGGVVVCDRYAASSVAYQGYGRQLDLVLVDAANALATNGLAPHLTVLIDIAPEVGIARKAGRDRFEREDAAFYERVRRGYLTTAATMAESYLVLDGTLPVEELAAAVWRRVEPLVGSTR